MKSSRFYSKILKTRLLFCFQMHFTLKTCTCKLQNMTYFSLRAWILWCPGDTHIPKKRKFKIKFNGVNVFAVMNGNSKWQIELIIRWTRQLLNWDLLCNQLDIIYHTSLSEFKLQAEIQINYGIKPEHCCNQHYVR